MMNPLVIEETFESPYVCLDLKACRYEIKGKSVISEVEEFYSKILDWLDECSHKLIEQNIDFIFDLEYFNIASSKRMLFILYRLNDLFQKGASIKVIWKFNINDDEMKEVGEDFACMVNLPFEFVNKTLHRMSTEK